MSAFIDSKAKSHFLKAAGDDVPAAVQQLERVLSDGFFPMHNREFFALADAAQRFLGQDVHSEKILEEWDGLSPEEQAAILSSQSGLGEYGLFASVSKIEVPLALTVAGKLLSDKFTVCSYALEKLSDPENQTKITARFPLITKQDIESVLVIA